MSGSYLTGPPREAAQGGQKGERGGFSSTDPSRFLGATDPDFIWGYRWKKWAFKILPGPLISTGNAIARALAGQQYLFINSGCWRFALSHP